jgi:hypothetical protein
MISAVTTTSLPWGFRGSLTRPHDGDSFFVLFDTGFSGRAEVELRLKDVHAPELGTPGGRETTDYVNWWLGKAAQASGRKWPLWADVEMTTTYEPDMRMTFTRYVATVYQFEERKDGWPYSLNAEVTVFLASHPEWGGGK